MNEKSVLVFDIPHCCHDCICADWDQCLCKASNREIYSQEYMNGGRQAWCPLKLLPIKKMHEEIIYANGEEYLRTNAFSDYEKGYNACLDEITGDTE